MKTPTPITDKEWAAACSHLEVALRELVAAEKASCEQFGAKEIDALEEALAKAEAILNKPNAKLRNAAPTQTPQERPSND